MSSSNGTVTYSAAYLAQDQRPFAVSIIIPMIVLSGLAVAGRLASRKIKRIPWLIDDWVCIVALVFTWGCSAFALICLHFGVGLHIQAVSMEDLINFKKTLYAFNLVYVATPPAIKLCILLMYKRIFATREFVLATKIVGSVLFIWFLVCFLMGIFNCLPIDSFWDPNIQGTCISFEYYSIGYAVVNISTDIVILALPIRVVWNLQLPKGQKIALTLIFMLGSFVCAASLVRLLSAILNENDPDATWGFTNAMIWTSIEPSVGIICACLPVMRPLVGIILPGRLRNVIFGATSGGNTKNSATNSRGRWPSHFSRLGEDGLIKSSAGVDTPQTTNVKGGGREGSEFDEEIMLHAIHVKQEFEVHAT